MSDPYEQDTSPPAFPITDTGNCATHLGMSLRDYFAGKAVIVGWTMAGLAADGEVTPSAAAMYAYAIADAMLEERDR